MNALARLAALLLASTATGAAARDYLIVGTDIAGRATVAELGGGKVRVSARVRGFAGVKDGSWTGDGKLDASGLAFTVKKATFTLKLGTDGQLDGAVGGRAQLWVPARPAAGLLVLSVPGFSTAHWARRGAPYLDENLGALKGYGFETGHLALKPEDPVETNARFIAAQVKAEAAKGVRVILLAHGKGFADAAAALALDPALVPLVAGVIALQPAWGGSHVSGMLDDKGLEPPVRLVLEKLFKAQGDGARDLDLTRRAAFVAKHPYPAAQVPTVVVRSTFDRKVTKSPLAPLQRLLLKRTGQPNDGLVLLKDQLVPGALSTQDVDNLDHFESGLRGESKTTPLALTTRALLPLLAALK